jgi:hypothetical protein
MRFWISGPHILGIRPGISFRPGEFSRGPSPRNRARRAGFIRQLQGSFIYIIRGDHGLLKIGISSNPSARLAQLRTASAVPLTIAYVGALRCDGYAVEAEAHRTLAGYRLEGEWFNCPVDMAVAAIAVAAHRLGEPIASGGDPRLADETVRMAAAVNDMAAAPRPWHWLGVAAVATIRGVTAIVLAAMTVFCFYLIAATI